MKSFMIMPLVKPIDLMTEISLTCSYRLPVIDDDREKKQMNIVIAIITLKIISSVCSAYWETIEKLEDGMEKIIGCRTYLDRIV